MEKARIRIGKVKLKNGPVIVRLPTPHERHYMEMMTYIRSALGNHTSDITGYAFVCWHADGATTATIKSNEQIPRLALADMVKNRLLAMVIEGWTIDTVNDQWGGA